MPIPEFREDGYLPEGVHLATEAEVVFRFGASTQRRRNLVLRLRHILALVRVVGATRFLVDGSFVTVKAEPGDIDAVVLLSGDFEQQVQIDDGTAVELYDLLTAQTPDHLFAAQDEAEFQQWVNFFGRTRETDGRRKGVVEVHL